MSEIRFLPEIEKSLHHPEAVQMRSTCWLTRLVLYTQTHAGRNLRRELGENQIFLQH